MIAVAVSMANGYLYCLVAQGRAVGDPTSSPTALRWITGGLIGQHFCTAR